MASLRLPHSTLLLASATTTTQAIDANNDGAGAIFLAPRTGTITKIGVYQTTKAGTAPTYRYGVEGVTTTRAPDGTYLTAGTAYVDAANPANGFAWRTLGASVSVTAGDELAATVRYQSGTIDGSNNITVAIGPGIVTATYYHPFALTLTGGTWAVSARPPSIVLQYDDGYVISSTAPFNTLTNNAWNSGSSPIYRGTKWTPEVTCRCVGVFMSDRLTDTSDLNILIYAGSASSPAVTRAVNADEHWGGTSTASPGLIPIAPTTLTAGTVYRFVVEPTTVNNNTTFAHAVFEDADCLAAYWGDLKGTTGVAGSPPTWTDYDNGTDGYRAYPIIPVIDDVTTASGGAYVIGG